MRGSLAVAGVFGLLVGLSSFFVVSLQREEIAASGKETTELGIALEKAKQETLALQKTLAWRTLEPDQIEIISKMLSGSKSAGHFLVLNSSDPEPREAAPQPPSAPT
jgi:hypothetical protein